MPDAQPHNCLSEKAFNLTEKYAQHRLAQTRGIPVSLAYLGDKNWISPGVSWLPIEDFQTSDEGAKSQDPGGPGCY